MSTPGERTAALVEAEHESAKTQNPYTAAAGGGAASVDVAGSTGPTGNEGTVAIVSPNRVRAPTNQGENDRGFDEALATMRAWRDDGLPETLTVEQVDGAIARIAELGQKFYGAFFLKWTAIGIKPAELAIVYLRYHIGTQAAMAPRKKHYFMLAGLGLSEDLKEASYGME